MKIRELFIIVSSVLVLLVFMGLMFKNYLKNKELEVIKKHIHYDSLLIVEQQKLQKRDSIIISQQKVLRNILGGHSSQLHIINKKFENLEENGENK